MEEDINIIEDLIFEMTTMGLTKQTIEYAHSLENLIKRVKNSIPKSKIKEKIEELNKRIEQYDEYSKQRLETDVKFYENIADTAIVQVLKDLLEDK